MRRPPDEAAPDELTPDGLTPDEAAASSHLGHLGACSAHAASGHHGYLKDKDAILRRLARIEGQVRGIARMVGEDQYCIDVITRVSAAKSGLDRVALLLLEDHLGHCVAGAASAAAASGDSAEMDEKVAEATAAIARLLSS